LESRKKDHIDMAFLSHIKTEDNDRRFFYEPLLSAHPVNDPEPVAFLNRKLKYPMWVSSMTGGTELAGKINSNLARACREFGMGMGLGSCRIILDDDTFFQDFNMRPIIGPDLPLLANLGIAQLEMLISKGELGKVERLVDRLQADGIIIHVNPLQEWMQPEGDRLLRKPVDSINDLLLKTKLKVVVKEVGQGMGPESLLELLKLPLAAIEFGAFGGTNFAKLELLRNNQLEQEVFGSISHIGHSAIDMLGFINEIESLHQEIKCRQLIISGGVKSFLDGFYLIGKSKLPAIYGQASGMLKYARESYEELKQYVTLQTKGFRLAQSYLRIRE
jgi:isopentenyl-diphosphate Delta-isomerase